ncbi:MAG: hypothetical protein ACXWAT_13210 [Methylobacter sp.]
MKYESFLYKNRYLIFTLLITGFLSACAPTVKYGVPPKVDRLGNLKVGSSSRADILMTLGEPRGRGATRFSNSASLKYGFADYHDIWFYEYLESDGKKVDLKFLIVFIDQDHYNGHFWFSSAELMEVKR